MNTFRHSGSLGDMIFSLPIVKALGGGLYYLRTDMAGSLKRLFEIQPYLTIEVVNDQEWKALKDEVTHDLDAFRGQNAVHVVDMHSLAFNVTIDKTQPYLFNVPPNKVSRIVVNDTGRQRFPGDTINWELLRPYEKDCVFLGNDRDYEIFLEDRKMDIPRYRVDDLYDFARVIQGSELLVCNMSVGQTMAEGLKKPYVVDLYVGKPQHPMSKEGRTNLSSAVFQECLGEVR